MSTTPQVFLIRNPYRGTVPDNVLLQFLQTAALEGQEQITAWQNAGEIEDGRDSFAAVLYDPTLTDRSLDPQDLIFAIILYGPNAENYLPNGASKVHCHYVHGLNMGVLVNDCNHLLADGEFGWGNSADYKKALGGGSGYSVIQDGKLLEIILKGYVDRVRRARALFLREQREAKPEQGHRWFDPDDRPNHRYLEVSKLLHREGVKTVDTEVAA